MHALSCLLEPSPTCNRSQRWAAQGSTAEMCRQGQKLWSSLLVCHEEREVHGTQNTAWAAMQVSDSTSTQTLPLLSTWPWARRAEKAQAPEVSADRHQHHTFLRIPEAGTYRGSPSAFQKEGRAGWPTKHSTTQLLSQLSSFKKTKPFALLATCSGFLWTPVESAPRSLGSRAPTEHSRQVKSGDITKGTKLIIISDSLSSSELNWNTIFKPAEENKVKHFKIKIRQDDKWIDLLFEGKLSERSLKLKQWKFL